MRNPRAVTSLTLNQEAVRFDLDPATPLLFALRDAANLTGAKHGCDDGGCGACTVWVDDRAARSCQLAIGSLEGASITTIEGLAADRGHPLQQAWLAEGVSQCGFCEPGLIMALAALLRANPRPAAEEIEAVGHVCRCGIGPRAALALARAAMAETGGDSLQQIAREAQPSGVR